MMRVSPVGIDFIIAQEGLRLTRYLDSTGLATIGVGHLIRASDGIGQTITEEQARELLRADLNIAETAVNTLVTVDLTQNQFDALASFVFNIGTGAFRASTLLRLLNTGDFEGASEQFSRWTRAGGKVISGLVKRRARERQLFKRAEVKASDSSSVPDAG